MGDPQISQIHTDYFPAKHAKSDYSRILNAESSQSKQKNFSLSVLSVTSVVNLRTEFNGVLPGKKRKPSLRLLSLSPSALNSPSPV